MELIIQYNEDEMKCKRSRQSSSMASSFAFGGITQKSSSMASSFASFGDVGYNDDDGDDGDDGRKLDGYDKYDEEESFDLPFNSTILDDKNEEAGGLRQAHGRRCLALKWHPFHPDVQKTVHFWGCSGS